MQSETLSGGACLWRDLRVYYLKNNLPHYFLSWYDNEWGYVTTLVRHVKLAAKALKK
jgi:glyceraldehyde-3-phosphate dehydrogenase/erythrose-4-phosphate dehydrogenase